MIVMMGSDGMEYWAGCVVIVIQMVFIDEVNG